PDGSWLVSGGEDGITRVWDLASGKQLDYRILQGRIAALTVTPDGSRVVAAAGDHLYVWVPAEREAVLRFDAGQQGVASLAVTPDGKRLLTGGHYGSAKL